MEVQGVSLVVGAGGIGKQIALGFARHGATALVSADINSEASEKVIQEAKELVNQDDPQRSAMFKTLALQVDASSEESVNTLVKAVVSQYGRIDYFVNSSGFGAIGQQPISSYSLEDYRKLDEAHHIGTFLLLRAITTQMLKQDPRTIQIPGRASPSSTRNQSRGSIVIVASLASEGGYLGVAPYIAAKHAVKGLVKTCALENARQGIRVNAVSPSYVSGPMIDKLLEEAPAIKDGMLSDLPLGRLADAEEVADSVLFLSSGLASYINGHVLIVDGGASASLAKGAY